MSEKHALSNEKHEHVSSAHEHIARHEHAREVREKALRAEHEHANNLANIREKLEKEAVNSQEVRTKKLELHKDSEPEEANTYWHSREYRELAFKQFMGRVRGHLSTSEKLASRVLHQPVVERASEVGSKTVARTSGVLLGSIFSFIISLAVYILSKRYAYDMTYSIFIASFLGGFLLGIIVEFLYKAVRSFTSR
jgi:hypothetical protein